MGRTLYTGKVFSALFGQGKGREKKKGFCLAVSEPDECGDIEIVRITDKRQTRAGRTLVIPKGILPTRSAVHIQRKTVISRSEIIEEIARVDNGFLGSVLKELVLKEVVNYYRNIHRPLREARFVPGVTKITYGPRIYDHRELANAVDSSLEFYLTAGRYDREFCAKLSDMLSSPYGPKIQVLTVNSGSSANLLSVTALTSHNLGELRLREKDEVITVAAGFPTTVAPIIQNKLIPVFVDIRLGDYNIDTSVLKKALSPRTRAICIAHMLGIPFDLDGVLETAEKYKLWVIEDNCGALGAEYTLKRKYRLIKGKIVSGKGFTGTFGHIGTSSFYPAHHITMGEGGAVYTSDRELLRILMSLRDWGRDCRCAPGEDNACGRRFKWKLGDLPRGYDHKYVYSHLGYNFKITDMQAAIGVAQLDKLKSFARARRENWHMLYEGVRDLDDYFILPGYPAHSVISPFGFPLTVKDNAGFTREDITGFLESRGIQTRLPFAGNILRQPAMHNRHYECRVSGKLHNTDTVMRRMFFIGVSPRLNKKMIAFVIQQIREFVL